MKAPIPFTKEIFWDTNFSQLEIGKNDDYIIEKVLNFGTDEDWTKLKEIFSKEQITQSAISNRNLKPKTVTYLATIWDIPLNKFRCYTEKQSQTAHFDY